jgi:hypothetical protein
MVFGYIQIWAILAKIKKNESYGSVNSHGLWAWANTNNPYKVGDGPIFIPDFPLFVMNDDVHVLIK